MSLLPLIAIAGMTVFSTCSLAFTTYPFKWGSSEVNGVIYNKAFILVPVKGKESRFLQLDTGSPNSYVYGQDAPATFLVSPLQGEPLVHQFKPMKEMMADEVVGTLGNDAFDNQCLAIDFPNQHITAAKCEELPSVNHVQWLESGRYKTGHLTVKVSVGEQVFKHVVVDTGSSMFGLLLTRANWQRVVAKKDAERPPYEMIIRAWGQNVKLGGANLTHPACLENACIKKPAYMYLTHDPGLDRVGLDGILGNALFYDSYTLVLDFANDKVGLMKSNVSSS